MYVLSAIIGEEFLVNESFESSRGQMKGTVDGSINKHLCLHLNLQMKNKG